MAGRIGAVAGRAVGMGGRGAGNVLSSSTRTIATTGGRGVAVSSTRTTLASGARNPLSSSAGTIATNPNAANFSSKTGFFTRTFNQTFRGTNTVPTRTTGNTSTAFSRSSANPISSGAKGGAEAGRGAGKGASSSASNFSKSAKNPLSSGGKQAGQTGKTWGGRAKSFAKGTATHILPHTVGLLPLLLMNQNPLKGLENMLNPANWVQDLSWLGGLLNPENFKQDMTWVENMMKNLGGDIGSAFGGMERFAEGAFRDVEAIGKDTVWGVEEAVKYAPYIGGFIAVLWVVQSLNGK